MSKKLMKGNEAIAEAAIRADCRVFFGYPITPSTEGLEYTAKHFLKSGGVFVQAASEIEAVSMAYGAAATGKRCWTITSSPGASLMQETLSYMACAQLPFVLVNIMRGGPGLGDIQGAQSDYNQAVKGGGHGDYRTIVLAPGTIQEAIDLTMQAFDLADIYRIPVVILGDGMLGQMAEPVEFKDKKDRRTAELPPKNWALQGAKGRKPNLIVPFDLDPEGLEKINLELAQKHSVIEKREVQFNSTNMNNPDIVLVAYGTVGRIATTVVKEAKKEGINVGLIRPITLWPFPHKAIYNAAQQHGKDVLVVEMSMGQMVEDVRLAVDGQVPVHFLGRAGGIVPSQGEILDNIYRILGKKSSGAQGKAVNAYTEGESSKPRSDEVDGMKKTHKRPSSMSDSPFSYCSGCHHSTAHRLIAEVLDELGITQNTIGVFCVGCAVFGYKFFNIDSVVPAHGRAPAVATGIKRTNPDKVVFAYQGDGDLGSIGLTETVYTANRGEPITVIYINNAVYAMTGGQMAPTTLEGQVTSTSIDGRNIDETGYPIKISEMLATLEKPAYIARVSLTSPKNIIKAKKAIKKAFELQLQGEYAIIEILSACPIGWKMTPRESLKFIDGDLTKAFPLGVLKDTTESSSPEASADKQEVRS